MTAERAAVIEIHFGDVRLLSQTRPVFSLAAGVSSMRWICLSCNWSELRLL